jgi:hypothetical protein
LNQSSELNFRNTKQTPQSIQKLRKMLERLDMDDSEISDKLFLIRREQMHDVDSKVCVVPITDHIQSRLAIAMRVVFRNDG